MAQDGNETAFPVYPDTLAQWIIVEYARRKSLQLEDVSFQFEGATIHKHGHDTLRSLGIQHLDTIDVMQPQVGD